MAKPVKYEGVSCTVIFPLTEYVSVYCPALTIFCSSKTIFHFQQGLKRVLEKVSYDETLWKNRLSQTLFPRQIVYLIKLMDILTPGWLVSI